MPAVIPPRCSKLSSAGAGQRAEVLSIIFLLPWNCLVSALFSLACAAGRVCAIGEVVTDQEGGTWLQEGQPPRMAAGAGGDEKPCFQLCTNAALPSNLCLPQQPDCHLLIQLPQPVTPSWGYLFKLHNLQSLC